MTENSAMRFRPILLKRALQIDAAALFPIRYAAYLPLYGAYGAPSSPCAQSRDDFYRKVALGDTFVMRRGDQIVGGASVIRRAGEVEIEEIYVSPDQQRRGAGSAALNSLKLRFPSPRFAAHIVLGDPA